MSYSTVAKFEHGEILTSAKLTQLDANLDAIYAVLGDAAQFRSAAALVSPEDEDHWIVHRFRWLWFKGDGTLSIPALGVNDEAISDSDSPTRLDLNAYKMGPGTLYKISDCTWCLETRDP